MKCLLVVSLQIPKVYTAMERLVKLCMIFDYAYFLWYSGVFIGGTVQQRKTEYLMFHNVKTLHLTFYICVLHISQCEDVFSHNTSFSAALCASLSYKVRVRKVFFLRRGYTVQNINVKMIFDMILYD